MEPPIKKNKFSYFARSRLRLRPQEIWERDQAEPGRAKRECSERRMVRTPPFFPQFGGKTIFGSTFQILLVARFSDIQFLHKNTSINPKSVEFHQCHAKRHSIWFFYHNIKDNDRNLWQHLLTIENTDTDLKVHALHYANELLVRVRLSFQKLSQHLRSTCRNDTKKCLGKELCRVLVVDESTDHDKPHFDLFPTTISTSKKMCFFFRARDERELKIALRDTLTRGAQYG